MDNFDDLLKGQPPLLKVRESAELLRMHDETVKRLIRTGQLIGVQRRKRQGSPILVSRDSIRDYLARNQL
jgi:hypothetical protein